MQSYHHTSKGWYPKNVAHSGEEIPIQIKAPIRKTIREIAGLVIGHGWREIKSHLNIPNTNVEFITDQNLYRFYGLKTSSGELDKN